MPLNAPLLFRALDFAARRHAGQRRKDAAQTPYINHCLDVATILASEAGVEDGELLMAAVLHDTVEDVGVRPDELEALFGLRVREWVEEVTDDKALDKARRKALQVEHAAGASHGACLIKFADKIANLRSLAESPPADWDASRVRAYADWAEAVLEAIKTQNPHWQAAPVRSLEEAAAEAIRRLRAG